MMNRIKAMSRWAWKRKWRVAGSGMGVVIGAYACTFALVACSTSPTDQRLSLSDGRELAYLQPLGDDGAATSGETRVILVHGAPADASSWGTFLEREGDRLGSYDVVVVDRLGYGNSTPATETSLEAQARALDALITPGTILVGHSYGGPVVLRAATEFPDRVGGIVLVAGACDAEMRDAIWFRKLVNGASFAIPASWATSNRELLDLTDENDAMRGEVSRVTCPVAILHGTWDPVCPHDGTVSYLEGALVNANAIEVRSIDRAGHNLHVSRTRDLADLIDWCADQGKMPRSW